MAASAREIQVEKCFNVRYNQPSCITPILPWYSVFDFLGVLRVARTQHRDVTPVLVPRHSPNLTVGHTSHNSSTSTPFHLTYHVHTWFKQVSTIGPELLKLLGQVRTY